MESKGWITDRVWKQGLGGVSLRRCWNSCSVGNGDKQLRQNWAVLQFFYKKIIPSRLFHNMASSNRRGGTSNWSAGWWNCETRRNIQDGPFSGALPAWEEMEVTVKDKWTQAWTETDKFPVAASGVKIWTFLTCLVLSFIIYHNSHIC